MPLRYVGDYLARALRVHQRLDDDLLLALLPFLPCHYGHDWLVWTRETSSGVQ